VATLREEARLCRQTAAYLSLWEERAHVIRMAERHEARAAALEADAQAETLQAPSVAGATVAPMEVP
jgi:hypothetical protein